MAQKPLQWAVSAASEQGRREENQDRMTRFPSPFGEVVVVADGMGGMRGGATAAAAVTALLPEYLQQTPLATPATDALRGAVRAINAEIYRQGHGGDPAVAHMGTTIVLALLRENGETLVANIGDSRAYLFRQGVLRQLTKDHSAVQRLVDAGALSPEEARHHPESSVLTRAIGQQPEVQLEVYPPFTLEPGDGLLLCSDGLSGFTGAANIQAVLTQQGDPAAAVKALGAMALSAGSDDNITIQYLRVQGGAAATRAVKQRAKWPVWAGVAAAVLVGAIVLRPSPVPHINVRINNATGEHAPVSPPAQPDRPGPGRTVVTVYVTGDWPRWPKLDCAEFRYQPAAELEGKLPGADPAKPHIYYRREGASTKDCLRKSIPALAAAKVTLATTLPNHADVLVVLSTPQKAEN